MLHAFGRATVLGVILLGVIVFGAFTTGLCAQAGPPVPIDSIVDAPFVDVRWQPRRLSEFGRRGAFVIYFATVECPMVRRYLPRVGDLAREHLDRDVVTVVANVGSGDAFVDAAAQAVEFAPHAYFAKDVELALAAACGVDRSGTVVVLDRERRLRYRGRIDDQYGFGTSKAQPASRDLQRALTEVLADQPVSVPETSVVGCRISPAAAQDKVPTYHDTIAPLLRRHCTECHAAGAEFPFSLVGEANVQKHARMIAEVTDNGRMPPWSAAGTSGSFLNHRGLSLPEREAIRAWVAGGMPSGANRSSGQESHDMRDAWAIGTPHLVLEDAVGVVVPVDAPLRYHDVVLPHRFAAETWIEALEVRSEGAAVLHHCHVAFTIDGEAYDGDHHIGSQVMHGRPIEFQPGTAFRLPRGARLVARLWLVPDGREAVERVQIGLRFPRMPVRREVHNAVFGNDTFRIPPRTSSHRVEARWQLPDDAIGVRIAVQMHGRGRDVTVFQEPPFGERQAVLTVPTYSFSDQEPYVWLRSAVRWPKGTQFVAVAHYDNSPWNPANPDPDRWVTAGPQSTDECLRVVLTWVSAAETIDVRVESKTGMAAQPGASGVPGPR